MKYLYILLPALMSSFSLSADAQKIKIGNYTFKNGATYTGELSGGKPNGKGRTEFPNGDIYEGDYVKGLR
ncbi:MAG: phosphatidylinositol-4-phosphate 5-kinase, partial [Bacteroidaceae bacterium]|nr:phosphatidylinositol-4-phosphate 5-kinase [Bacteroidaceae bacterium]